MTPTASTQIGLTIDADISRLRLATGDVLLAKLPEPAFQGQAKAVGNALRDRLDITGHQDVPILLLTNDFDLTVASPADIARIRDVLDQAQPRKART